MLPRSIKKGDYLKRFCLLVAISVILSMNLHLVSAESIGRNTQIEIKADTSAKWVIEIKYSENAPDNEIQEYASSMMTTMAQRADNAEVVAGRSMGIENYTTSGPTQIQDYKKLRCEFVWTNFVEIDGVELVLGDSIETGLLDLATTSDYLTITYPEGYGVRTVSPDPDQRSGQQLTWIGPESFGFGQPTITLRALASPIPYIIMAVVISAGLIAGWFLWFKKLFKPMLKTKKEMELPEVKLEPTLKSDSERVNEVLKAAGGKLYQNELVRRLDVSKSKGSEILNAMEQNGEIQRMRMGRTNLVSLKPAAQEQGKSGHGSDDS